MTLRIKILAGYGLALALILMILAWALFNLKELGRASESILRENYQSILAADSMLGTLERQDSAMLLVLLGQQEEGAAQFREHETQFLQWLARAKDNITIEGEAGIIQGIEAEYAQYLEAFSKLLHATPSLAAYRERGLSSFQRIRAACLRLRELNQTAMYQASRRVDAITSKAIWSTAAIGALALVAGLVFSLLLSKRLVALLLRDVTRLREVEQFKSQFVMTASHELKTPLTSIGMSIELLLESASPRLDEQQRQLLAAAHEEVRRLKALVNDLLDLARIEAGRIELEFDRVPVQALFSKVAAIFAAQADQQGVELAAELPGDLPEARADANKITWVLTNLVSNALRYVSRGGHIRLEARRANAQLHLSVRDDGAGIPPEYQSKIFDKFFQVKGESGGQGTGLGLAICREIVRAHGGAIWAESVPGEGSTFTFTLPIAE